jgi:hypothetical protein
VDERHFEHAGEVLGGFLKSCEDSSAFFQPADQSLNDVSLAICVTVEHDRPGVPVFVLLGGNYRLDFQPQQTIVNPVGSVSFVSRQGDWPRHRFSFAVANCGVRSVEQGNQGGRFMVLTRRQMKVKRMPLGIAQQVDFGGKPAARTA